MVSFQEFKKLELQVGTIKEVNEHPNADKLYLLKVSFKDFERQLVAGVRSYYDKESLVGKQVICITNLEPAVIRGEKSEGMLLAAQDRDGISILTTERPVEDGSRIS